MTEEQTIDPFETAARHCRSSLTMARRVAEQSPSGFYDEDEVWFYAQAFSSAFTAVMDAIDNVAKRYGQSVVLIVETWKNQNRDDYYSLAAEVRNKMQHGGLQLHLRSEWVDEEDHMNDTVHRVRKFWFVEIKRKGEEVESLTLGEWAVYIFTWWEDQIAQLRRLWPRADHWHKVAEDSLGRPIKYGKMRK